MSYRFEQMASLHEAGHAVCGHVLGVSILKATRRDVTYSESSSSGSIPVAAMLMAGGVAVRLFGPRVRHVGRDPSDTDLRHAAEVLGMSTVPPAWRSKLEGIARQVLVGYEGAVRDVAKALMQRGELTGEEIALLVPGGPIDLPTRSSAAPKTRFQDPAALPGDASAEFPYESWQLRTGDWYATLSAYECSGQPGVDLCGTGATEEAAVRALEGRLQDELKTTVRLTPKAPWFGELEPTWELEWEEA